MCRTHGHALLTAENVIYFILYIKDYAYFKKTSQIFNVFQREHSFLFYNNFLINIFFILLLFYIFDYYILLWINVFVLIISIYFK